MITYTEENNEPLCKCARTCYKSACVTTYRIPLRTYVHVEFSPHLLLPVSAGVIPALTKTPQCVCFSALNSFSAEYFPHLAHSVCNLPRTYMLNALCYPHLVLDNVDKRSSIDPHEFSQKQSLAQIYCKQLILFILATTTCTGGFVFDICKGSNAYHRTLHLFRIKGKMTMLIKIFIFVRKKTLVLYLCVHHSKKLGAYERFHF